MCTGQGPKSCVGKDLGNTRGFFVGILYGSPLTAPQVQAKLHRAVRDAHTNVSGLGHNCTGRLSSPFFWMHSPEGKAVAEGVSIQIDFQPDEIVLTHEESFGVERGADAEEPEANSVVAVGTTVTDYAVPAALLPSRLGP